MFDDYEEGLAYAAEHGKPVMLDFTGWACVNCRKMEENVWDKPGVYDHLKDDFVVISLYVDDRNELPEDQQLIITKDGAKRVTKVGQKWAKFQEETFANNSQPWYCLITPDEKLLNIPRGYTPDVQEYTDFLQCGLNAYERMNQLGDNTTK